jgi:hypothetical protein
MAKGLMFYISKLSGGGLQGYIINLTYQEKMVATHTVAPSTFF